MSLPNVNNLVDLINKTRLTEYDKLVKDTYLTSLDIIGNDIQYTYGNKQTKTFTLPVFKGATSDTNGTAGLVPAPPTEDSQNKYLRGDGTWAVISGSEEIVISETEPTSEDIKMWVNLTGDSGVTIPEVKDNEISEQDTWSSKKINEIINNGVNSHLTKSGTPRFTAEIIYQYITDNPTFIESHTGLEDVEIERQILAWCKRQHKKMRKNAFS